MCWVWERYIYCAFGLKNCIRIWTIDLYLCDSLGMVRVNNLGDSSIEHPVMGLLQRASISSAMDTVPRLLSSKWVLMDVFIQPECFVDQYQPFNSMRPSDIYMHQKTIHHWSRLWLVAWLAPSHYLNQCWNIVNWNLNKLQYNLNQNSYIFIQENMFESVVCDSYFALASLG